MNRSLVSSMMDPGRRTLGVGYTMKHVEEELVSINSTSTTFILYILCSVGHGIPVLC